MKEAGGCSGRGWCAMWTERSLIDWLQGAPGFKFDRISVTWQLSLSSEAGDEKSIYYGKSEGSVPSLSYNF